MGTQDNGGYYAGTNARDTFPPVQRSFPLSILLVVLLWTACSPSQDVVGRGPIQKRKYRSGWNLELRGSAKHGTNKTAEKADRSVPMDVMSPVPSLPEVRFDPAAPLSASSGPEVFVAPAPTGPSERIAVPEEFHPKVEDPTSNAARPPTSDDLDWRPWERMAIIAGIFMVLTAAIFAASGFIGLVYYLLGFAFITGLVGLWMGMKHKRKGKGLAIAAILFSIVMLILAANGYEPDL